jgi:hypothetical protein
MGATSANETEYKPTISIDPNLLIILINIHCENPNIKLLRNSQLKLDNSLYKVLSSLAQIICVYVKKLTKQV